MRLRALGGRLESGAARRGGGAALDVRGASRERPAEHHATQHLEAGRRPQSQPCRACGRALGRALNAVGCLLRLSEIPAARDGWPTLTYQRLRLTSSASVLDADGPIEPEPRLQLPSRPKASLPDKLLEVLQNLEDAGHDRDRCPSETENDGAVANRQGWDGMKPVNAVGERVRKQDFIQVATRTQRRHG